MTVPLTSLFFWIPNRNTFSKVYPAMYIDNVTELAFDDVTPEDPDFPFIQGEACKYFSPKKTTSLSLISESSLWNAMAFLLISIYP